MPGLDPISLATSATQIGIGALQSLIGGGKARKAQRQLENLQTPTYTPNQSILDYYNKALENYNVSPTDSLMYKNQQNQILRNQAAGLSALGDRRSALAGVNRLVAASNDASLKSGVEAENWQAKMFQELGSATGMKAGEDRMAFQQNQIAPYEKKYNLLALRAGGANQATNAGLTNIFGGLSSMQQMAMLNKMYNQGYGSTNTNNKQPNVTPPINMNQYQPNINPSDIRLKENYFIIGKSKSGINIYEFSYKGNNKRYQGVMAQEVAFASVNVNGYLFVDYSKIDVEFKEV